MDNRFGKQKHARPLLWWAAGFLILALLMSVPGTPARASSNQENTFTIESVIPDPGSWTVMVKFDRPVPLSALRYRLKILPRVKINWSRCKQISDKSVVLTGDFKAGEKHLLIFPPRFKAKGLAYRKTVNTFSMPDHTPRAVFLDNNRVIEKDSGQMLHLQVVNLERLTFNSLSVPPALLPLALASSRDSGVDSMAKLKNELDQAAQELKSLAPRNMDPLLAKPKSYQQLFTAPGQKNQIRAFSIPLTFRPDRKKGSLEMINISAEDERGRVLKGHSRLFSITDLGLSYKFSDNELLVWVTSLNSGMPLESVRLYGFTKELEVFPLGRTDRYGISIFQPSPIKGVSLKTLGGFKEIETTPGLSSLTHVLAVSGDDVSYIEIRPKGNLSPENISQVRRSKTKIKALRGHLFTERGVYRPGDKVHFKGTIREYRDDKITTPLAKTAHLSILDPKGASVLVKDLPISEFGTMWGELELKPYFSLGTYTMTLRYGKGKDQKISRTFQVQEFRPPRHYAEIGFEKFQRWDESIPEQPRLQHMAKINIKGLYYAGGQVKHGRVRYKIFHTSTKFTAINFPEYSFGFTAGSGDQLLESGESILDEQGRLTVEFPLDPDVLNGRFGLKVTASVIDFDGRSSGTSKNFKVEPGYLIGIGPLPPQIKAGVKQSVNLVVLDKDGQRIKTGQVTAEVLQESGAYVRKRNQAGDLYWDYQGLWRRFLDSELDLTNGEANYKFDLAYGGQYVLSVTYKDGNGQSYTSAVPMQAVGDINWDDYSNRDKPFEVLDLDSDKEMYEPGQTATVYLQPHKKVARYLVTLEQDRVISHRVMEADPGTRSLEIPIKKGYAPNVFVSVLALGPRGAFPGKPLAYDAEAPSFLFGTINLSVRPRVQELKLELGKNQQELKAEPGTKVTLEIKALRTETVGPAKPVRAEMALAVVDESVLALTAFKTPSLDNLTEFDLPLAVFTGELRRMLLHQTPFATVLNRKLTGGGGMAGSEELETRKYFNPVAYYTPNLVTGEDGTAKVEFTLPDTITRYRIYAVACDKGSSFANAERELVAVKDFYVEPGLPRFLTKGDKFSFGVKGFNTTEQPGSMKLELSSSPNLKLLETGSVEIPAQSTRIVPVSGQAIQAGAAHTLAKAGMNGYQDAVRTELPVLSGNILSHEGVLGSFRNQTQVNYTLPQSLAQVDWKEIGVDEVEVLLTLSGSPFLQMSKGLRYLLRYPYGCVEQTSSAMMPLAALRGLINQGLVPGITAKETEKYLTKGVNRLWLMQTVSGGMGYWPGYMNPHAWGSVYAGFALSVAQANGVKVDPNKMKKLMKYLKSTINKGSRSEVYRAMAAYVLALNKSLDKTTLSRVAKNLDDQSYEATLLVVLAASESGLGEKDKIVPWTREFLAKERVKKQSYEFRANYLAPAIALLTANKILGQDPLTDQAALRLLGGLSGEGIWSSTSDTGWALVALGEYFRGKEFSLQEAVQVGVVLPDGTEKTMKVEPKNHQTISIDPGTFLKNPKITLKPQTDKDLMYLLSVTLPRPDYSKDGNKDGFIISKSIENTDGKAAIKVGDLVKVKVRLEPKTRINRYVMLDDPLPAGLVAINSALKTEEKVGGSSLAPSDEYVFWYRTDAGFYRFVPNFFEIRDERVLAFRDRLWTGAYEFTYYARAVCAGEFVVPPTKIELMYQPEVRGFTPSSILKIEER